MPFLLVERRISFELEVWRYCLSDEFAEFYTVDLSGLININWLCAFHLFDALLYEFERWVYDAMTEIADSRKNTVENEVGIDAKGVKAMMH